MEPEPEMSLLPEFEEGNSSLKPPPAKRSAVAESDEADSVSPPGSPVSTQSVTEEIPMPMLELRSEENHGYPSGLQPEENPVVMPETESVDNRRNMLVSLFDATLRWMREWPEYLLVRTTHLLVFSVLFITFFVIYTRLMVLILNGSACRPKKG